MYRRSWNAGVGCQTHSGIKDNFQVEGLGCVVFCEERDRLKSIHLSAVRKHLQPPSEGIGINSAAWRKAMKKTQKDCNEALTELNRHKKVHGC